MTLRPILDYFTSVGCAQPDIGLLQPADPFLDTTGEDLRRRIFMTQDNGGAHLCLRPEFTVPVCLHHLDSRKGPTRYAYGGSVFRQRKDGPSEFLQAGFEDLGRPDTERTDAECIAVAAELLRTVGQNQAGLIVGHQSVFVAVLQAMDLPQALHKKLIRAFGDQKMLQEVISQLSTKPDRAHSKLPSQIVETLQSGSEEGLVEEIKELMLSDGLPLTGSRTPHAIAIRLKEQFELGSLWLDEHNRSLLERFLEIDVPLTEAVDVLERFASDTGLSLENAIRPVESLASSLANLETPANYRASFGRRLDYYTGLVFEFYSDGAKKPVIGGGRYDQLMTLLGASSEIPAVGFAVWLDRLGVKS